MHTYINKHNNNLTKIKCVYSTNNIFSGQIETFKYVQRLRAGLKTDFKTSLCFKIFYRRLTHREQKDSGRQNAPLSLIRDNAMCVISSVRAAQTV